jgi:hypothetical protein
MWVTVLLMAVIAGLDPAGIAAVRVILSRSQPMRRLVAYLMGGTLEEFADR